MAGEWSTLRLGDVCTKIGSGATPRGGSSVYLDQGDVALIRSQNVYNDGFHHDGLVYLTDRHATQLANVEVEQHDVLLNITGDSVARACEVDPNVLPARVNQHVAIIRPNPQHLWPKYLRFLLVSPTMQAHMLQLASAGATRNALTKGMIESFSIPAPRDVKEQQAIACILGALDDRIELNRRMNKTLEEMARAIFKSWFVDFDPVRAKAAGQQPPGLKSEIAALFPDSFENSEMGEIPKGWRVQYFTDDVEVIGGGTPKTSIPEYWGGEIPWFSVVDTPAAGELFVIYTGKTITQKGVDNSSTRVLPIGTTIISARGTVGNLALVAVPMAMNQSCYGLRDRRRHNGYFLYFTTSTVVDILRQRTHGSVFNTITRNTLDGVRVVTPPDELVTVFEKSVGAMLQRILTTLQQNYTLAALRDSLLPKLISGELRVPDAERIAGRCL